MFKETYTITQAAILCDVVPETVRKWVRSGKLKAIVKSEIAQRPTYSIKGNDLKDFYNKRLNELYERKVRI